MSDGSTVGGTDGLGALPWRTGAKRGLAAFAAGLVGIAVLVLVETALAGSVGEVDDVGQAVAVVVGLLFYNAHFVGVVVGGESVNLLGALRGVTTVPTSLFYAVPPAILYLAGNAVAHRHSTAEDGYARRTAMGATVVAGYFPAAVAGALALLVVDAGPNPVGAALIAGLAYPLVLGGLGGLLAKPSE